MKIAVISDIHGNLEAFTEVLRDIDDQQIDQIVCLGDMIGYGPDPDAVVQIIRHKQIWSIAGNHEWAIIEPGFLTWFNPLARQSIKMTQTMLQPDSIDFIRTLPRHLTFHGARFVHGFPPQRVALYLFQVNEKAMRHALGGMREPICFVGHTHELRMVVYTPPDRLDYPNLTRRAVVLQPPWRVIVNAGSVGQPRDGDHRAKYVIWDTGANTVLVRRVSYDIAAVVEKMKHAGMPVSHQRRLWC